MYLVRKGKVEFTGNKHNIIEYIKEVYEDNYYVQEYWDQMEKDTQILKNVVRDLDMKLTKIKPKRKGK